MKRSLIVLLPLSAAFVLCAADPVPTGESILEKYVAVTGGKPAYEKMRTQITTAVMEFIGKGVKANMTMYHSAGNKSYMVTEIQGKKQKTELKAGTDRLWDSPCEAAYPARDTQDEEDDTEHHTGGGDLTRAQPISKDDGRDRFHRLHRQRQAVEQPSRDQEHTETK